MFHSFPLPSDSTNKTCTGLAHCPIDRDGAVIGSNIPIANGLTNWRLLHALREVSQLPGGGGSRFEWVVNEISVALLKFVLKQESWQLMGLITGYRVLSRALKK